MNQVQKRVLAMSEQESVSDDELAEELVATAFAMRWLHYAGERRSIVREPADVFKVENAAMLAAADVRDALHDQRWCPGAAELKAVMAAVISLMN